jgi:hypothetical protein
MMSSSRSQGYHDKGLVLVEAAVSLQLADIGNGSFHTGIIAFLKLKLGSIESLVLADDLWGVGTWHGCVNNQEYIPRSMAEKTKL